MKTKYLDQIESVVLSRVKNLPVKVYLFGSRAKGEARPTSDVDIAILATGSIPPNLLSELRYLLEESNIPYKVDLVDLASVDDAFREQVIKYGVLWKD